MRTFTDKDKRGILVALRVFLRSLNGERVSQQAGIPLIEKALAAGVTIDILLNRANWQRALEVAPELQLKDYIELLCSGGIEARALKDEPDWHVPEDGFAVIAEAAHDFFMEVSGNGGKWNIPSALVNLAKAVRTHSLQAVLSEKLINQVKEKDEDVTYFNYVLAIVKDFNTLDIDDEAPEFKPVPAPVQDENPDDEREADDEAREEQKPDNQEEEEMTEEVPFPEEGEQSGFETVVIMQRNPNEIKEATLKSVLLNYSAAELLGILKTMDGGLSLTLRDVISKLAEGKFDVRMEDTETRRIHQQINSDLMLPFIDCVNTQGQPMDQELASSYDILHDTWDLRSFNVRKRHKLLKLIFSEGMDDPDLLAAAEDIEKLYSEE